MLWGSRDESDSKELTLYWKKSVIESNTWQDSVVSITGEICIRPQSGTEVGVLNTFGGVGNSQRRLNFEG